MAECERERERDFTPCHAPYPCGNRNRESIDNHQSDFLSPPDGFHSTTYPRLYAEPKEIGAHIASAGVSLLFQVQGEGEVAIHVLYALTGPANLSTGIATSTKLCSHITKGYSPHLKQANIDELTPQPYPILLEGLTVIQHVIFSPSEMPLWRKLRHCTAEVCPTDPKLLVLMQFLSVYHGCFDAVLYPDLTSSIFLRCS